MSTSFKPTRRRWLAATAGASVASAAVHAQDTRTVLRFQSTWPTKDIFHEYAQDFAKKVNDMTAGRLRIEVLPANSVVKAFGLLDAVHKGQLDGGHSVCNYWYAKNTAFGLFGSGPALGFNANTFLAWMQYGGGQALYDELLNKTLRMDIQGFLYGPMPMQPLGWFKRPIRTVADLTNMKFRAVGLPGEMFKELGMQPAPYAAGEIVSALDNGLIDAAEYNNPSSDRGLGLAKSGSVCMLRSYHQTSEVFEVLFNRKRFESLSNELRSIIRYALQASSADMSWKAATRYAQDYQELRDRGIRFEPTPNAILQAQLSAWKRVVDQQAQKNPLFARVLASQREFARPVVGYQLDYENDQRAAYEHWFGARKVAS